MVICSDCEKEMTIADSCTFRYIIDADGTYYERDTYHFDEPGRRCHDCGIKHGNIHHWGCDVERCPKCGLQLLGCGCWPEKFQIATTKPD